jgi:anthranilate synthase component 1
MYTLITKSKKIIADTITPVSIYLKLRDKFPHSLLLESSDYHANKNSFSYICCNPIASIKAENNSLYITYPDDKKIEKEITSEVHIPSEIENFAKQFKTEETNYKFIHNGLFGYTGYDSVKYFESIQLKEKDNKLEIPDFYYAVYQNIIAINHFNNEAFLFSHNYNSESNLDTLLSLLQTKNFAQFNFETEGEITSNIEDEVYKQNVEKAKAHCARGDVFQLVLSKRFSQKYNGDDFNVYRALRSVNPSPYLFYFDYGNFKIFGSSPEAQLVVEKGMAEIHPIAGTIKRSGDDEHDAELAKKLASDAKENSEHVMLVDLARNDLSRNCSEVTVETYREIQFFSHVIHLVSKVTGKKKNNIKTMQLVADIFPAGTLSGAPKYKALELIEKYETVNRTFYGGAIGVMDFKGNFNHAIMIRTFLSKDHQLHWQAGAGIVTDSKPENELQEVYNKLGALTKALEIAKEL